MRRNAVVLILILAASFLFEIRTIYAEDIIQDADKPLVFVSECDKREDFSEIKNVSLYKIPESDQAAFYDDFTTLQRIAAEEAYVVLPIPYMHSVSIESYYRLNENIEGLIFQASKDGKEWKTLLSTHEVVHEEEGKWSCVLDVIPEIESGTGLLKIIWPENDTVWSPVVGKITAELEERRAERIDVQEQSVFAIPRFDSKEYALSAQVMDQMNLPMDIPIIWELENSANHQEGFSLSADGILAVTSETSDFGQYNAVISCRDYDLSAEWMFELKKALLGDCNYDFVIDDTELEYALSVYKATSDSTLNWDEVRLVDINNDGTIDVYDIAYLSQYQTSPSTGDSEPLEETPNKDIEHRKD